jgi:hypothetical protein
MPRLLPRPSSHGMRFRVDRREADHFVGDARVVFDEFLILRFRARNEPSFPFAWLDELQTNLDYGAALTRILRRYETRF